MFEDEARFGRMIEPRRAWAPPGVRPLVAARIEPRRAWAPPGVRPLVAARIEREYGYA
jgi:hypothetical protein